MREVWPTSEALFQALRFAPDDRVRQEIRAQKSPMAAKMIAKKYVDRMVIAPHSPADVGQMAMVLRLKVRSHEPDLGLALLDTGDACIIEDCSNRPRGSGLFWGAARQSDGSWKGRNVLGELWMKLRGELRGELRAG
jgi:predicted NAD-dependent protein-ADP-ribosyltransferase YbiA (DUF1768 family)